MKCMARLVMRGASTDAASCVLCSTQSHVTLLYDQSRECHSLSLCTAICDCGLKMIDPF